MKHEVVTLDIGSVYTRAAISGSVHGARVVADSQVAGRDETESCVLTWAGGALVGKMALLENERHPSHTATWPLLRTSLDDLSYTDGWGVSWRRAHLVALLIQKMRLDAKGLASSELDTFCCVDQEGDGIDPVIAAALKSLGVASIASVQRPVAIASAYREIIADIPAPILVLDFGATAVRIWLVESRRGVISVISAAVAPEAAAASLLALLRDKIYSDLIDLSSNESSLTASDSVVCELAKKALIAYTASGARSFQASAIISGSLRHILLTPEEMQEALSGAWRCVQLAIERLLAFYNGPLPCKVLGAGGGCLKEGHPAWEALLPVSISHMSRAITFPRKAAVTGGAILVNRGVVAFEPLEKFTSSFSGSKNLAIGRPRARGGVELLTVWPPELRDRATSPEVLTRTFYYPGGTNRITVPLVLFNSKSDDVISKLGEISLESKTPPKEGDAVEFRLFADAKNQKCHLELLDHGRGAKATKVIDMLSAVEAMGNDGGLPDWYLSGKWRINT